MNSRFKLLVLALAVILCACSRRQASSSVAGGTDMAPEAKYLTLIQQDDCVMAEVSTPWSGGKPIATYRIDKPLERSVVFSSVHTAAIDELGAIGCVAGVADGAYFVPDDTVARLMANGRIADVGSSMSPMVEKIIDLDADAVLVSAMEGGAPAQLVQSGIPVIYLADYLEETPLARAEWIKFIGLLYGRGEAADSVWNNVRREYTLLRDRVANVGSRPVVLTEKPMSGVWYVPGGHSYMARLIADAGGKYPWDADTSTASARRGRCHRPGVGSRCMVDKRRPRHYRFGSPCRSAACQGVQGLSGGNLFLQYR